MAENPLASVGGELFGSVFSGAMIFILIAFVAMGVIGVVWWFFVYRKKFDIKVKIIAERAGAHSFISFDEAAILKDRKTQVKYFKLWYKKVELPVPKFNVLQNAGSHDYLELYRKGEDEYYYLTPPDIDNVRVIKADGQLCAVANQTQKKMETDVEYWNVKRKDVNKKMFDRDSLVMKLIEMAPQILSIVGLIFILWIFMDKLPAVLGQLERVASEINQGGRGTITPALLLLFSKWKN